MGANHRPKGGGGQSTLEACAQPLAVEFLLLLFFAQTKEKKGTPQRAKEAPQRYLPPGGFALVGSEYVPIDIVVSVHEQLPRECLIIDVAL